MFLCLRVFLSFPPSAFSSFNLCLSLPLHKSCYRDFFLSYVLDIEYSFVISFTLKKRFPICPARCIPDQARISPATLQERAQATFAVKKNQKQQMKLSFLHRPSPFPLRYCVAKRYTSDDSFLLASGFTVLVFWNSSVSLLCNRWL